MYDVLYRIIKVQSRNGENKPQNNLLGSMPLLIPKSIKVGSRRYHSGLTHSKFTQELCWGVP